MNYNNRGGHRGGGRGGSYDNVSDFDYYFKASYQLI